MDAPVVFALLVYFLPYVIAEFRGHHLRHPILVINLFLGWTGLGWILALAMSVGPKR
jgi:hypothetical protein